MRYLILFLLAIVGCSSNGIRSQYDSYRENLQTIHEANLAAIEKEAEGLIAKNSLHILDDDILAEAKKCFGSKNIKKCLNPINEKYSARMNISYPGADFEKQENLMKAYPNIALEEATNYLAEQEIDKIKKHPSIFARKDSVSLSLAFSNSTIQEALYRNSHNEAINKAKENAIKKENEKYENILSKVDRWESEDVYRAQAQDAMTWQSISNSLNQMETNRQLQNQNNTLLRIENNQINNR